MMPSLTARGSPRAAEPTGPADRWAALIWLCTVLAHARYALLDQRAPADPGLYYREVPAALEAIAAGELGGLLPLLGAGSGWMNVLIALAHAIGGGAPQAVPLLGVLWVGLLVGSAGRLARQLGGPMAGLITTALTAAAPIVILQGRTLWIHVPEAALALGIAALLAVDPRLRSPWRLLGVALGGALLLSLRASGLGWAPVALSPLIWARDGRPSLAKISLIALFWGVAASVSLADIVPYLEAKAKARQGYIERLPPLTWEALSVQVGLTAVLLPAALVPNRRAAPLLRWMSALSLVLTLAMWWTFRAGIDNFTLLGPALAMAVAAGLSRAGWAGGAIGLQVWLLAFLPQFFEPRVFRPLQRLPPRGTFVTDAEPNQFYRPWTGYGAAAIQAVIAAACGEGPCVVAVNQGLFTPFGEEPGRLGVALLGWDNVQLVDLRHGTRKGQQAPDLLVSWDCPNKEASWIERFPQVATAQTALIEAHGLEAAWGVAVSARCAVQWWSPGGALTTPELLPSGGGKFAPKLMPTEGRRQRGRGKSATADGAEGAAPAAEDAASRPEAAEPAPKVEERHSPIRSQRPRVRRSP